MSTGNHYCEYFDVDEAYFPCIDESAIHAGARWDTTYPHSAFIDLLNCTERMLSGTTKRSLWIHGDYGTGKSRCAYAVKKLLDVPENEARAYWEKYESLKKHTVLLEKLLSHKEQGVLTAYRYASGGITTPQQLFLAVQESIRAALDAVPGAYKGEHTLKEAVISWLSDPTHSAFIDSLLQKPEWMAEFSQSSAQEIIRTLQKGGVISGVMDSVLRLAAREGITALTLTAESLRSWILDVLAQNHTKIVLIWDEFSDFFRQNRNSLGEFQKLVSICQEAHFYFVVITHPISSLSVNDNSWKVVQQRFDKVEITLPSTIAFDLIGSAFPPKQAAKEQWDKLSADLNSRVPDARAAVMKAADIRTTRVMQGMIPIHPMAAFVLNNIASAFQSNQRSMFDFIKTPEDMDVKAFQWFIRNTGPFSDRPLLTVDMLWDFFYEKGKDYLSQGIRLILDTFPQQSSLTEREKAVLKTVLILQAIDQRLHGSQPVLKPTNQNLSYAFEGDCQEYEHECKHIAQSLVDKGILITTMTGDGRKAYSAAVLAGDSEKIDRYKNDIRKNSTISKLVEEGPALATALALPSALKLRYATVSTPI